MKLTRLLIDAVIQAGTTLVNMLKHGTSYTIYMHLLRLRRPDILAFPMYITTQLQNVQRVDVVYVHGNLKASKISCWTSCMESSFGAGTCFSGSSHGLTWFLVAAVFPYSKVMVSVQVCPIFMCKKKMYKLEKNITVHR